MAGTRPDESWVGAVDVEQMMNNMGVLWIPRMTDECVWERPNAHLNTTRRRAALLSQVATIIPVCLLGMSIKVTAMDAQAAREDAQNIPPLAVDKSGGGLANVLGAQMTV